MTKASIDPPAWNRLLEHCRKEYPAEACGFLLGNIPPLSEKEREGRVWRIQAIRPAKNIAWEDRTKDRFQIDPKEYLQARKEAKAAGLEIVGFYHSHPDHPARPSAFDSQDPMEGGLWSGVVQVIASVKNGQIAETAAFVRSDEKSEWQTLQILPSS